MSHVNVRLGSERRLDLHPDELEEVVVLVFVYGLLARHLTHPKVELAIVLLLLHASRSLGSMVGVVHLAILDADSVDHAVAVPVAVALRRARVSNIWPIPEVHSVDIEWNLVILDVRLGNLIWFVLFEQRNIIAFVDPVFTVPSV